METTISRTVTIKPYKNGAVVNNEEIKTGKTIDVVREAIQSIIDNLHGSIEMPVGDRRLEKEFTVTVTFNLKD